MTFEGKVAIVTGAARGIGRNIAEQLAAAGCKVVIADVKGAEEAAEEMKSKGFEALGLTVNVTESASVEQMVNQTVETFGRLDILVNNAGITRDGLLMRMKEEDWDLVLAINLKGAFNCCKAACRTLMKSPAGRIINIASIVGLIGNPGQVNYSASKAGMIGLTKTLAKELASRKVTVNAVAPGFIQTAMTDQLSEKVREQLLANIPLGEMGTAQDVANAVLFLASDQARYISGHVLNVDGGMAM
jgi:3-oxoacyl-[acyl-carrier protein] reductase